jgi:hypothetical protein
MERIAGYMIIIFAIIINLTGFLGIAFIVFPKDSTMVSGILAFIGSIIGGLITFFGVKMTLEYTTNEKILGNSSKQIFILEDSIRELTICINAITFTEAATNITEVQRKEMYLNSFNHFSEAINKHYEIFRLELDYSFIKKLSMRVDSFNATAFILRNNLRSSETCEDNAQRGKDIYDDLMKHKQLLVERYYKVKGKQSKMF